MTSLTDTHAKKAGWLAIAIVFVAGFEGYASKPYVDYAGTGHPITWCFGATGLDGTPIPPMTKIFTKAECEQLLGVTLQKYDDAVKKCIHVPMGQDTEAAVVSEAYNLGPGTVCKYVAPRLNAGDVKGACAILRNFDHGAGGRQYPGLTRRRFAEQNLCIKGDS